MTEPEWIALEGNLEAGFRDELAKAGSFGGIVGRFPFHDASYYGFLPRETLPHHLRTLRGMYVMPPGVARTQRQPGETCRRFLEGDPRHRRVVLRDPSLRPGMRLTPLEKGDDAVVVGDHVLHVFSSRSARNGLELPLGEYPLIAVATELRTDVPPDAISLEDVVDGAVGVLVAGWDAEAYALADLGVPADERGGG